MRVPLEMAFKHVEPSAAMESLIRERVQRLHRYAPRIISARIAVEAPHLSPTEEPLEYRVRLEVSIPGQNLVAVRNRDDNQRPQHDPYRAIREAFTALESQLKSRAGRLRRGRHPRVGPPHAVVTQLHHGEDYGFLRTASGREVYFHRNSVLNDHFDDLEIGDEVRFEEREGLKGPQASTVQPIGTHGTRAFS